MINWEKLLSRARLKLGEDLSAKEEERLEKIIKFIKYRIDPNIYQRKEIVICWDHKGKEKETRVEAITKKAESFSDYCDKKHKNTVFEYQYIFEN